MEQRSQYPELYWCPFSYSGCEKNEADDAVEAERHQFLPHENVLENIPSRTVDETGLVGSYTTPGVAFPTTTQDEKHSINMSTSGSVEVSVTLPVNTTGTRATGATATGPGGDESPKKHW